MQTALKCPTAFKSHDFGDGGVMVPVSKPMTLGLREVKVSLRSCSCSRVRQVVPKALGARNRGASPQWGCFF